MLPRRVEAETPPTVVLPPEAPEAGYLLLPMTTLMAFTGSPNVSAATTAITDRVPVPRSWLASVTSTEPSG